jgi:hypothetical protein
VVHCDGVCAVAGGGLATGVSTPIAGDDASARRRGQYEKQAMLHGICCRKPTIGAG